MDKIESSPKTNSTHKWSNLFIIVGLAQFVAVGVLTVIIVLSHMSPEPVLSTIMTYRCLNVFRFVKKFNLKNLATVFSLVIGR